MFFAVLYLFLSQKWLEDAYAVSLRILRFSVSAEQENLQKENLGFLKATVSSKMFKQLPWRLSHIFLCFFLTAI